MVGFNSRMPCETKFPPAQRLSVGHGAATVRSPYGPLSFDPTGRSALHQPQPTPRGTEILGFWKAANLTTDPESQVSDGGAVGWGTAIQTWHSAAAFPRLPCAPLTPARVASPRLRRGPLSHVPGPGISSVLAPPGVPPVARGNPLVPQLLTGRHTYALFPLRFIRIGNSYATKS